MMRRLIARAGWLFRRGLRTRPRSEAEEIWRLRWMKRRPAGAAGGFLFRGAVLSYSDGRPAWDQLNEIYLGRVYDFTTAASEPRILDCGAHIGIASMRLRELFPAARITAFEADPEIAAILRRNLLAAGDRMTQVVAAAVWVAETMVGFRRTGSDNGHLDEAAIESLPAKDLGSYCEEPVDLLKLDIEGAEEEVIEHLQSRRLLGNVRRLVCEWHQWTPDSPRLHRALAILIEAGFVYRIAAAGCLGDSASRQFPALAWPGNHIVLYAWLADESERVV